MFISIFSFSYDFMIWEIEKARQFFRRADMGLFTCYEGSIPSVWDWLVNLSLKPSHK